MDVIHRDTVDRDLDRLLSTRASEDTTPDPTVLEASYLESVRIFHARRRDLNREAWVNFHQDQARRHRCVLEALVARHEREAERLQATDERKRA